MGPTTRRDIDPYAPDASLAQPICPSAVLFAGVRARCHHRNQDSLRLSRDCRPTTSSVGVQDLLALAAEDLAVYAVANWPGLALAQHHKIIVEKPEAVERGEIDRLMIFTALRHGESMITSQFFPARYLGRHPDRYMIGASHGAELSLDFGRRVRNLIADALHQAIFPGCRSTEDSSFVWTLKR